MIKKNIEIKINSKTRQVFFDDNFLGIQGENLQGYLIFKFEDEFVNGTPVLKIEQNGETYNIHEVIKGNDTYKVIIKSSLLKSDIIYMALHITENGSETEIPVFISKKFHMYVGDTIETTKTIPDEYVAWIDIANQKMAEIDNLNIEMQDNVVTITRKDGTQYSENVKGDAYEITEEDYEEIENQVKTDIQPILDEAKDNSETAISIAKGANQALDYLNYESMITNFNAFAKEQFSTGQNIMIKKLNVPDMWIYQLSEEYKPYTYTTDEEVINLLLSDNGFHVGYYVLSALETQKVDLTEYVKNTDYANTSNYGVVKLGGNHSGIIPDASGYLKIIRATNAQIDQREVYSNPIVPANLDYAVGTVKASETQSGTAKMWMTTEDGETGLNISTEV